MVSYWQSTLRLIRSPQRRGRWAFAQRAVSEKVRGNPPEPRRCGEYPHQLGRPCPVLGAEDVAARQDRFDDAAMDKPLERLRRSCDRPPAALDGAYLPQPDGACAQRPGEVAGRSDCVL